MSELAWLLFVLMGVAVWWQNLRIGRLEAKLREFQPPASASAAPTGDGESSSPHRAEPPPVPKPAVIAAAESPSAGDPPPKRDAAPAKASFEERLTQKWFVWLGALVTALGALFLVRAAADAGIFGPRLRLGAAGLGGIVALLAAEWLVRRTAEERLNPLVPAALASAGSAAVFATVWAASALYSYLPTTSAFIAMAAIAFLTTAMALRHGQLLAWLGLGGGLAAPVLAGNPDGSVAALLAYLAMLFVTAFGLLRLRLWCGFLWMLLPALAIYPIATMFDGTDGLSLPLFLLAIGCAGMALPTDGPSRRWWRAVFQCVLGGLWLVQLEIAGFVSLDLVLFLASLSAILSVCFWREFRFNSWIMPILGWLVLLVMDLGYWDWQAFEKATSVPDAFNVAQAVLVPGEFGQLWRFGAGLSVVAILFGMLGAERGARPGLWATIATFVPLGVLAILYLRLGSIEGMPQALAAASLALAAATTLLTARNLKRSRRTAAAATALAALGALGLVGAIVLTQAWLPLALSALALGAAYLWRRLQVRALAIAAPWIGWSAAFIALLDPKSMGVFDGALPTGWGAILAGTALPAAILWLAARMIDRRAILRLQSRIQLAGLVFVILTIGHGTTSIAASTSQSDLVEAGLRAAAWFATLAWLVAFARKDRLFEIATFVHLALLGFVALPPLLVGQNPLWVAIPVGKWPIVNLLLPAYGLPVMGLALLAWACRKAECERTAWRALARLAAMATCLGILGYLALEVRRAFHGPILTGPVFDGELYAYSVMLLALAALLLGFGIAKDRLILRRAGITVMTLALFKLFLIDLAHLDGILRAVSFLGLGFGLIGVGYALRRWAVTASSPT